MANEEQTLSTHIESATIKILQRFDDLEKILRTLAPKSYKQVRYHNGEVAYDNQDLCEMFNKSKRSLQRYRSLGELEYCCEKGKTIYTQSQVDRFQVKMAAESERKKQSKLDTEPTAEPP